VLGVFQSEARTMCGVLPVGVKRGAAELRAELVNKLILAYLYLFTGWWSRHWPNSEPLGKMIAAKFASI
jgi:hypothetical protein